MLLHCIGALTGYGWSHINPIEVKGFYRLGHVIVRHASTIQHLNQVTLQDEKDRSHCPLWNAGDRSGLGTDAYSAC